MDARAYLIAQDWKASWEDVHRLVATMQRELDKYKAREDANLTAVAIKQETIRRIQQFIEITGLLIEEQATMLEKERGLGYKYKELRSQYAVLYSYAKSKGLDTSLLPYMTTRDYNIIGL